MSLPQIKYCPGTLANGFETYSRNCLNRVFDGKKVSHVLPYGPPEESEEVAEKFLENRKRISISGVQEKLSLVLEKNKLRLTEEGEQGTYILKPIPGDLKKVNQIPANEHLTMQMARQVYGINTAENALIFFSNGDPAYITKRFDVKKDGSKQGVEDFASLAGKTSENDGADFKYNYSYEEVGELIRQYVPAFIVELEKYFQLVMFNYLVSNGDAHLKNFSLLETANGDYTLSPAYDLINTRIHVNDTDFALNEGLFKDGFESDEAKTNGRVGLHDFQEFSKRLGIKEQRMEKLLNPFRAKQNLAESLIQRSFLNPETKEIYLKEYQFRCKQINKT